MGEKCPVCESENTENVIEDREVQVPFGSVEKYKQVIAKCHECEVCLSAKNKGNEAAVEAAYYKSQNASLVNMLDALEKAGIQRHYFERSLRLPVGEVKRWVEDFNEVSDEALALLRFVCTYPWLLEVSDENFKPAVINKYVLRAAVKAHEAEEEEKDEQG